jgi:hypothetical protein
MSIKTNLKQGTVLHDVDWDIGVNTDGLFVSYREP